MGYTTEMQDALAIVGTVDPAARAAATGVTDTVDLKYWRRATFYLLTGTLTPTGTLDFKVQGCATTNGTFADLTGYAMTQMLAAANSSSQAIIEIKAESAAYRYIRGYWTVGTSTCAFAVLILGGVARYKPISGFDLSSVAEIV